MLPAERCVSTNKKPKFRIVNGVLGYLHPANPCEEEEEFGSSSDSGQLLGKHVDYSTLAQSIVYITSFDQGGSTHPECTGIVFEQNNYRAYLLAPLSLFRSSDDERKINYGIKTKVRLPNNQVVTGILVFHEVTHNLAVVNALPERGCVRVASLVHQQQLESDSQVFFIRRCFNSGDVYCEEAAPGGVLVDILGNIVGLSCYGEEGTTFIPSSTMLDFLAGFQKTCAEKRARSADINRRLISQWEVPVKKYEMKGNPYKFRKRPPSDISCLEDSSRMEKKLFMCYYCDPEGLAAYRDRLRCLFPGPSWPDYGDDVSKEAARNMIRSRGYPLPAFDDCPTPT